MQEKEIQDLKDALGETFGTIESNLISMVNKALYDNLSLKPEKWEKVQLGINKKTDINNKIGFYLKTVRKGLNEAFDNVEKKYEIPTKELKKEANKTCSFLLKSTRKSYQQGVRKVVSITPKLNNLRDAILQQAVEGFDKGLSVPTKSGRLWEYKGYMEMRVGTTIAQEVTNKQLEVNTIAKNIFFGCNSFENCANDHRDFQGKVYYDERYKTFNLPPEIVAKAEAHIKANKMLSIQQVMNNKPYLTTRPNCRHRFIPLSLTQALGDVNKVLRGLNQIHGKYEESKYKQTQDLRYCERNIRKYKDIATNLDELSKKSNNKSLEAKKDKYFSLVKKWEGRADEVVKGSKGMLKRYAHREVRDFIINDSIRKKIEQAKYL